MSKIEQKSFEEEINDHYQAKALSFEKLDTLLADKRELTKVSKVPMWAAAAVLLLALGVVTQHQWVVNDRTGLALQEASMNHVTKLQFDFKPERVEELDGRMDMLPFSLRMPELAVIAELKILGARYCTLSGNLAAHLKFSDPDDNQQYSLFVTPDVDKIRSIKAQPAQLNGVDVKLWRENGLFYALAQSG